MCLVAAPTSGFLLPGQRSMIGTRGPRSHHIHTPAAREPIQRAPGFVLPSRSGYPEPGMRLFLYDSSGSAQGCAARRARSLRADPWIQRHSSDLEEDDAFRRWGRHERAVVIFWFGGTSEVHNQPGCRPRALASLESGGVGLRNAEVGHQIPWNRQITPTEAVSPKAPNSAS